MPDADAVSNTKHQTIYLPPELLGQIFRYAIAPSELLSITSPGPNGAHTLNIATIKSIILVCKSWFEAGIGLLYEDILIWRFPQVEEFISNVPPSLCAIVKRVTFDFYLHRALIPHRRQHGGPIFQAFRQLLQLCPNVSELNIRPGPENLRLSEIDPLPFERSNVLENLSLFQHVNIGNIKKLSLGYVSWMWGLDLPSITSISENLDTLEIDLHSQLQYLFDAKIRWQVLTTFRCQSGYSDCWSLEDTYLDSIEQNWTMPRLTSLSLRPGSTSSGSAERFLRTHGHKVTYLNLNLYPPVGMLWYSDYERSNPRRDFNLQRLLDSVPVLSHLVIDHCIITELTKPYPNIRQLDIWAAAQSDAIRGLLSNPTFVKKFPKVGRMRLVDHGLSMTRARRELPSLLAPDVYGSWRYLGVDIRQSKESWGTYLFRGDVVCLDYNFDMARMALEGEDYEPEDDETDSDYEPSGQSEEEEEEDYDTDASQEDWDLSESWLVLQI